MHKAGQIIRKMVFLLLPVGSWFLSLTANAQTAFIPPKASVFSHPGDSVAVFGNMILGGSLGTAPGSVVYFLGSRWQNTSTAAMPGINNNISSPGGLFSFDGKSRQLLAGGYNINTQTGNSFPNLLISNTADVALEMLNDLNIRGDLFFDKGHLLLNGQNALLDGKIYGYSDERFVVTGNNIGGGSLYRKPVAAEKIVYPVGTDKNSYSPAAILSPQASTKKLGIRVFDHVFEKATSGKILDSNYVKKTWVARNISGKPITIYLQHDDVDEGFRFPPFRDSSYVSLYHPDNGIWDMDTLSHHVTKGSLTTGKVHAYSYVNQRIFPNGIPIFANDARTWFSVSTKNFSDKTCPVIDFKMWAAQRYNGRWVQLFWRTNYELNVLHYEVQRKNDTSSLFETIGTVSSKGLNGNSNHLQYYFFADKHPYDGITQYRLKILSSSGCAVYTGLQQVSWGIDVKVWPNPSAGPVHVEVSGINHDIKMQVVDTWGQILYNYTISENQVLQLKELADATYFLVFRDPKRDNDLITTVKLVIQRHR